MSNICSLAFAYSKFDEKYYIAQKHRLFPNNYFMSDNIYYVKSEGEKQPLFNCFLTMFPNQWIYDGYCEKNLRELVTFHAA